MAGNEVHEQTDAALVARRHQGVEVVEGPVLGCDGDVVAHVVADVGQRARVDGRQPDRVDAQGGIGPGQVVEPAEDAGQVPDAVAVRIGEAAGVDLVEDRAVPPSVLAVRALHAVRF